MLNSRVDEALQRYESVYKEGNGWIKDIPDIVDGLTIVEREVIRSLLNNNGEIIAGILIGELITKFIHLDVEYIKNDILKMLNQKYNLVERDLSEGNPYLTREKIRLTSLGKTFSDIGTYYLESKLPIYFLQDRFIKEDDFKAITLSLDKKTLLEYIKNNLKGNKNEVSYLKLNIPRRSKIQKYNNNWLEEINNKGYFKYKIKGSYKYIKFLNKLTLYGIPLSMSLDDVLSKLNSLKITIKDISLVGDDTKIETILSGYKTESEIETLMEDLGYFQDITHMYYAIDYNGELIKASFDYLLGDWIGRIKDSKIIINYIDREIEKLNNTDVLDDLYINVYDSSLNKKIIITNSDELKLVNVDEINENIKYGFILSNEDVVLVTDRSHIKVKSENVEVLSKEINNINSGVRLLGAFPMNNKEINKERVFYFINQKGYVKVSKEEDLYTRSCHVSSTLVKSDESIVKIISNDAGKDKGYILFITKKGYIKVIHVSELKPKNRASKYVLGLRMLEDDEVLNAYLIEDDFSDLIVRLKSGDKEVNLTYKDYEIVTTKLHRGKKVKGIEEVEHFEIINKNILTDNIFI